MNNIFFISGAIGSDYGVFSLKERFQQVLDTIKSIRTYAPNDHICLYDCSEQKLPDHYIEQLQDSVDFLHLLHDHALVGELKNFDHEDTNLTGKKTFGELINTLEFLHWLKLHHPIKYNRVFKISARYRINENFKLDDCDKAKDTMVFSYKRDWYGDLVYTLRLYSFDYNQLDSITDMFLKMYNYVVNIIFNEARVRIIEFCMYKFVQELNIPAIEFDILGIEGAHGQDGAEVNE